MKCSASSASRLAALEHVDQKWAWHHCALVQLRQCLLHAASTPRSPDPETADHRATHDRASALAAVLAELVPPTERLAEVDAALQRIRSGNYGVCEVTGETIPASRLHAMPWVRCARPSSERRTTSSAVVYHSEVGGAHDSAH